MYEQDQKTVLPGILATIAAGFDLTAKNLWLLVLPVLLDLFLWLGPRLRFQNLIEEVLALLPEDAALLDISSQMLQIAPQTNLFTMLSVQIMGVPAMMVGLAQENTLVNPQVFEVDSWLNWLGLFILFTIVGLLLTAIYYNLVAYVIRKQSMDEAQGQNVALLARTFRSWLKMLGLVIFFFFLAFMIYLPLALVGTILFLINSTLGSMVFLIGPFILIWFLIYLIFTPSGIVLNGRPLLRAIIESARLVQANLISTLILLLAIIMIGTLLDWLLVIADRGTWLTIVNILAHSFVSTALLAAIFIYYRDRYSFQFGIGHLEPNQTLPENQ